MKRDALLFGLAAMGLLALGTREAVDARSKKEAAKDVVQCANLIYARSKSSVCFSHKFLATVEKETNIVAKKTFTPVKLARAKLFNYPFAIMTGEGKFSLPAGEIKALRSYLTRGGFLLASAGCSSQDWDRSFRRAMKKVFPQKKLRKIPLSHPIYRTVFDIKSVKLKSGGTALLEGIEVDGKIVVVHSSEGLNDTANVKGCCCCGGNEVRNCHELNVNIFTYALTH